MPPGGINADVSKADNRPIHNLSSTALFWPAFGEFLGTRAAAESLPLIVLGLIVAD